MHKRKENLLSKGEYEYYLKSNEQRIMNKRLSDEQTRAMVYNLASARPLKRILKPKISILRLTNRIVLLFIINKLSDFTKL